MKPFSSYPGKPFILLLIFALALSARLFFIANAPYSIESDEAEYDRLARCIMESRSYLNSTESAPTSHRPPLYPALLALVYTVFGHSFFIVRLIQALMGSFTACLLYLIAEKIFNRKAALFAGIFSAFYMGYVFYAKFLYTETFFTFLLCLITYLSITAEKPGIWRFSAIGFLCGFLTLTRSSGFFVPLIVIVAIAAKTRREKILPKAAPSYLALLLCFGFVLLPWTIRNYRAHGRLVPVSTNAGLNIYQAVRPLEGKLFEFGPRDEVAKKAETIPHEAERSDFYTRAAMKAYREDPLGALKVFAMRFLFFWNVIDWNVTDGKTVNYHYIFIMPFALLGLILSLKNRKEIFLPAVLILYFTSLVLVFQGFSRFRMPIDGFLIVIASYGIYEFINLRRKKIYPALCLGIYFLLTHLFYLHSLETKNSIRALMTQIGLWW